MPDGLLPLFPLEVVLFPQTPLPLHIFEERYKEMIGECLANEKEFGIVLVRGEGVVRIGCTASVLEVLQRHEDGKLDILTLGRRRFRLKEIHSRRTFLEAAVEYFEDTDIRPTELDVTRDALASYRELQRLDLVAEEPPELNHPELSFQLAQAVTDLDIRQTLLEMRSEHDRMASVAGHLATLVLRAKIGESVKKVARSNGHGKHLPGLAEPE